MKFLEYGRKNAPAVMLIHGMGCEGEHSFRTLIDMLKDKYRVIAVCLDGYDSQDTVFDSIGDQAKKISAYIEENIGALHTLLGMSMGGFIAIDLAERYGVKTDRLILDSGYLKPWNRHIAKIMAASVSSTYRGILDGKKPLTGCLGMKLFMGYCMKKEDMCSTASYETIYNSEYSCLTYKLPELKRLQDIKTEFWCGKTDRFMQAGMRLLR